MHVVFRESQGLEETETPTDLGQSPGDLVVLSFSDSDLGAFAAGWHRAREGGFEPTLRLANLAALKHPLSVDTYVEQTLAGAKGILIRLIGGISYWSYGIQQVQDLARRNGIALAVLPADGRADPRLDEVSTLPVSTLARLTRLCDMGGTVSAQAALAQLALAAGFYAGPVRGAKALPQVGLWHPEDGVICPLSAYPVTRDRPRALITFYRAYLAAADTAPIKSMYDALTGQGFDVATLFAPSLKSPEAAGWIERQVQGLAPDIIINATSFSGIGASGHSPLDIAGVPVMQVALSTSGRKAWDESERGLSPSDLAMHVVLPEVDGRLFGGVVSFKEPGQRDTALEFSRAAHMPEDDRINAIARRAARLVHLKCTDNVRKSPALILSTYPGKDWQMGHAVGLDAPASAEAILTSLAGQGWQIEPGAPLTHSLRSETLCWPLSDYRAALETLPQSLRDDLNAAWGDPEGDPACNDGQFNFKATRRGVALVALQPERGQLAQRDDDYHDLSRTPRHGYVAFYLWLRHALGIDALIHIGAHGTLEWLPGKAVALSDACWPEALIGDLPVIYPFIVNDPGEAAQAKRRIGALTLGHLPPPMKASKTPDRFIHLEALLDEFSNADGLDPRRRDRLQADIRAEAQSLGVEADLGLDTAASTAEAITRIDRFVCDIKESQFGDGLHILGQPVTEGAPFATDHSVSNEIKSLHSSLKAERVPAGPSGSPYRGRHDVLPTGRNLFTTDPRSVPTRSAYAQGVKLAEELVRRHLQDHGDYPKGLVVDLWGSATMRTAGEEFAMALHLLGVRPIWDKGSERVSGIEVLPITELDRPRLDVTLRVSGLFRDVFPSLSGIFTQAIQMLAGRDESCDWNPYAGHKAEARVFGPAPASYGLGMGHLAETFTDEARAAAGQAWLAASAWSMDGAQITRDDHGIAARVANADAFVHPQDLPESDLLLAADYATHEAGFAAAKSITGGRKAALYHLDNTRPETPRARALAEEIARVVQARAANPDWIAGMRRHGFRGAAEIAATLDHMAAFANLADAVGPHLFDLYYESTLGDVETDRFLQTENPEAHRAMHDQFAALDAAGLWQTRRNSIRARLDQPA
ncbi:cobaltochelatase subunit CobN [Sulfitobacter sp. BDSS02]|nr:cobaltochelatase subunit CobN [Sulfitobacter sp. BDSS02]MBR9851022.1 cobaltochelatase subunit CobN [Paracoccaceae bacterium]